MPAPHQLAGPPELASAPLLLPHWTILFDSRAAFTMARPSWIVRVRGFSQYTCFPARHASMAGSACQ